ncbi:zf-HC2 domain-containing protein [Vallicoccus soli]|uniref:zf-HC2 domain-containing protein n=1 Tax=Vallicoccus soli TaxID=2339232 RepID=UPI001C49A286|nr:zf-HC2 domain-containing protein [Vallicoccus soli]
MTGARTPRGPHLGPRVSALVDGELGHDDRDRCLAHAAECPPCLAALDAERRAKAAVARLGAGAEDRDGAAAGLPPGLAARLLAIADPPPAAPPGPPAGAGAGLAGGPRGATRPGRGPQREARPGGRADATGPGRPGGARERSPLRRVSATAGGLVVAASATLGVALLVGGGAGGVGGGAARPPVAALTGSAPSASEVVERPRARTSQVALGRRCSGVPGGVPVAPAGLPECVQRPAAPGWYAASTRALPLRTASAVLAP